ncbi:hypothetical protein C0J52_23285 [Blattella germanica]|nr:hypothetical protein C0J52_23285 [Blattella germanica]
MNKYNAPGIVASIKSRKLRWIGHIQRMSQDRVVKRILDGKMGGGRRRGRFRLIWIDGVFKYSSLNCIYFSWNYIYLSGIVDYCNYFKFRNNTS